MIQTINFRTRSVLAESKNVTVNQYWPIAIDAGYSSVKGFSPNAVFAFPSYAKCLGKNPTFYGEIEENEILFRDGETGEIWRVGRSAQRMIKERDTEDSQLELYGRDRYFSPMFKVILRTGIALGMIFSPEAAMSRPIHIQTGLPPAYLDEDKDYLIDVISGQHSFSIKTARTGKYVKFDFQISKKNVHVMSQPEGTLMSLSMDDNANTIPESKRYFQSNVLLFDAGFGTLDLFDIRDRTIASKETFQEFGMREILNQTGLKIKRQLGINIRPSAMQNYLERGTIKINKRSGIKVSSKEVPFHALLEESSIEVCKNAVEKIMNIYSGLFDYDYLVLTGGTSSAWIDTIHECFSEMENLSVIPGNENCPDLDLIFTNVRGYYMYLINLLRRFENGKR